MTVEASLGKILGSEIIFLWIPVFAGMTRDKTLKRPAGGESSESGEDE